MIHATLEIPREALRTVCERFSVRELAIFGSAARADFSQESDVDVLVEFQPGARIGIIEFGKLQEQLADLLGRRVDLVSKLGLNPLIREEILRAREIVYAA